MSEIVTPNPLPRQPALEPGDIPLAPKGIRQRDFVEGWRACEERHDGAWEALDRATDLAERYGEAILKIGAALIADDLNDRGRINRARGIIAGLDSEQAL